MKLNKFLTLEEDKLAGYVFTFSELNDLKQCIADQSYMTLVSPIWRDPVAATLGDYVTMRAGDNVYFFSKRKVYGIGKIVAFGDGHCVTENFSGATSAQPIAWEEVSQTAKRKARGEKGKIGRWIVAFEPDPRFFGKGVDMDDLLSSNPDAFRSLRVFWKRSFIKLDDEENEAFKTAILRANLSELNEHRDERIPVHNHVDLAKGSSPDVAGLLASNRDSKGKLSSEMLLEVGLLYQLSNADGMTQNVFGKWDYLSHQVCASPFKPVDYMDRIDVFGYRYIIDYSPIIEKYLVVELKKSISGPSDVPQIMKYVDWVCKEYAHGDYSLVQAFLVAHDFESNSLSVGGTTRGYVVGYRPAETRTWQQLKLVTYHVNEDGYVAFRCLEDEVGS